MTGQIVGAELAKPAAGTGTLGALPRDTNSARGLPPSTRLNRNSKIAFTHTHSFDQGMRGVYLDHGPDGLAMNTEGAWTPSSWYCPCVVELAEA